MLNSNWEFIGSPKGDKGVICSWIKELQNKGIVKQNISRSQLALVLNTEIKNINIGADGKTFDNVSVKYSEHKDQLMKLVGLLP